MPLSRGRLVAIGVTIVGLPALVFRRGPPPHLAIKPETLTSIGPFDLTNTVLTSWIVVLTIIVVVYFGTRRRDLVPRGFQNVFEAAIEAFYVLAVRAAGALVRTPRPRGRRTGGRGAGASWCRPGLRSHPPETPAKSRRWPWPSSR